MGEREPTSFASPWRNKLHEVIFEADTPEGKLFDVVLLWAILVSVVVVIFESVESYRSAYGLLFRSLEWFFTILFTIEYGLRVISVKRPRAYIFSFFGIIDLLAVLPTYLSLIYSGGQYLVVIRAVRLLRIFRVLKLARYVSESEVLVRALQASSIKITVFIGGVLTIVLITGTAMYLIEGPSNGFVNIPISMYWAIVTVTTVGFGDIVPQTILGQVLASCLMVLGYGIIAVPTGIVSVELSRAATNLSTQACIGCGRGGHAPGANYCQFCGTKF